MQSKDISAVPRPTLSSSETLTKTKKAIDHALRTLPRPVAVFDLDGTLFDVRFRTLHIVNDFIAQPRIQTDFPREVSLVRNLTVSQIAYSLEGTLNRLGIDRYSEHTAQFSRLAIDYWFEHFFTNPMVLNDMPFEKAAAFVHELHDRGCHIVYLSGRDVPNMSEGTMQALRNHGFPTEGHQISVFLKPAYGLDDVEFKQTAMKHIASLGDVFFTIDNEPANVRMFAEQFPGKIHVLFLTQHARDLELKSPDIVVVDDFHNLSPLN